jgi:hypothetical protein
VRSPGAAERPYVNIRISLARALDIQKGEGVEWKIVNRTQLLLLRQPLPSPMPPPEKAKRK